MILKKYLDDSYMKNKPKQKRIPLSMIRIYRLATKYLTQPSRLEEKDRKKLTPDIIISDFLKYTFEHKNDIL